MSSGNKGGAMLSPEYQPEKYLGEKEREYLAGLLQKEESGQEMSMEESADMMFLLTKSRSEPGEG
jgi:hypothetical protein